jgi:vitamin B12 transporter
LRISYNYSPSTYLLSAVSGDISKGKQLIYIPLHKFNASIQLNHGRWYSMFNLSMTGKRFVEKDNQQSLPAFILLNATAGREIIIKPFSGRIQLGIHNLSNSQYQVVEYYPEPGISVMFNLIISIQKIKNS